MTDQLEPDGEPVRTGVPAVDDVIADVDGLQGRELADHVDVFTQAHEKLRGVLDAPEHA